MINHEICDRTAVIDHRSCDRSGSTIFSEFVFCLPFWFWIFFSWTFWDKYRCIKALFSTSYFILWFLLVALVHRAKVDIFWGLCMSWASIQPSLCQPSTLASLNWVFNLDLELVLYFWYLSWSCMSFVFLCLLSFELEHHLGLDTYFIT